MEWLVLLLVSLVPSALWVWFFYRQDSQDREPLRLLGRCFFLGMLAVVGAAIIEIVLTPLLEAATGPLARLLALIAVVGLVEEFVKFAAFFLAVGQAPEYNEPMDGIIYAVTAALGFATVENLLYTASFGLVVAPLRAILACLAHASFSGIVGYHAALVRFRGHPRSVGFAGLLIASVLHGLYNFLIVDAAWPAWLIIPLVFGVYQYLSAKIRDARALSLS